MVDKVTINRFDKTAVYETFTKSGMVGASPDGPWPEPKFVDYVFGKNNWDGITYFTDKTLHMAQIAKSKYKIAILLEPREFMPQIYKQILLYENFFDVILTFDDQLLNLNNKKYVFLPGGMPIIELKSCKIHKKNKLVSMIYSDKKTTTGHKLRHIIADQMLQKIKFRKIDLFGSGTNRPIRLKSIGCNDYMFQIVIENTKNKSFFTEKILDCFITGCIPIYWGATNIGNWFDDRGILEFNSPNELKKILDSLNEEKYISMMEHVKTNFKLVQKYQNPDDNIFLIIDQKLNLKKGVYNESL